MSFQLVAGVNFEKYYLNNNITMVHSGSHQRCCMLGIIASRFYFKTTSHTRNYACAHKTLNMIY